ncbi:MAG: PIN domain-containing protein [Gammaproteobacteria bacterium]|nr:PIN domain-containing protein [Gammaproteobacteria bacterium]
MIYIDTSVALAHLLAEDVRPPGWIWNETLVASRLLEYELWNRLQAKELSDHYFEAAKEIVGRTALLELSPPVLSRALEPFPAPVRTLDALHLASADFLLANGQTLQLASYDQRMIAAADAMGIPLVELNGG